MKMFKVRIDYCGELGEKIFETEMPKIPSYEEMVGFWYDDASWVITTVGNVVYEFDENGNYLLAEINVSE